MTVAQRPPTGPAPAGTSRRGLFGMAGVGAAGLVAGTALGNRVLPAPSSPASSSYPFFGQHQAGITTAVQDHLHFAAFDVVDSLDRAGLMALLQDWSYAASRITQGLDASASGAVGGDENAPPDDTGEALGLPASGLTITFGFGPSLFGAHGQNRFGIATARPAGFADLPPFLGDDLDPQWTGGDLCIQACADDPLVAVHAIRNLSRIAFGRATLRWSQLGFGRTSKTTSEQETPRNLFGFKDGTANVLAEDDPALSAHVWVDESAPQWLQGGSFLVARKIAMKIETWDRVRLAEQERIFGRDKGEGAPLSGGDEFAAPDFSAATQEVPHIAVASHMALAHPDHNQGIKMLRRGYNYTDGNTALGRLDAGLFFLAYVSDVDRFITVQKSLSTDLLNEYIQPIGSGVFVIPPGAVEGSWVGAGLFGQV
ncbi:MAG: iron uptake transporter deferrochelatase/peroxidase subunit [Beutenbergiaceae bacterium]